MADHPTAAPPSPSRGGTALWALITGLAVGFAVGRETGRSTRPQGTEASAEDAPAAPAATPAPVAAKAAPAKPAGKARKSQAEFPEGWLKEADLSPTFAFAGLSEIQKVVALQALNERNCECGCGMGSIAICAKKDPNCPRSPVLTRKAIDLAKQGKSLAEVEAALDAENAPKAPAQAQAPPAPAGPKKIELAAWNPRKGPKATKVTIAEFSDFQ